MAELNINQITNIKYKNPACGQLNILLIYILLFNSINFTSKSN